MDPVRFHFLNSDVVIELFFVRMGVVVWSQVHEILHLAR